jgi:L-asparaginase II
MQMAAAGPLTVEITRGPAVESRHAVHALVMNGQGKIIAAHGDPRRLTYPRSSLKPLQALALVETGAADAACMSEAELALACASHSGEEFHTTAVAGWLKRLAFTDGDLECGAHAPYAVPCAPATILCNNCSGKHAGMLTLAKFLKVSPKDYVNPLHPVQQKILATMSDMCGQALTPAVCGIDGCSAPNPAMPLEDLARGLARLMNPSAFDAKRKAACARILAAMTAHPELVGGTGRLDTVLMRAANGKVMTKAGGEAVHIAVAPEKDAVVVVKTEDGTARASQAALVSLLEQHKLAPVEAIGAARAVAFPVLKNWRGIEVGEIRMGKT